MQINILATFIDRMLRFFFFLKATKPSHLSKNIAPLWKTAVSISRSNFNFALNLWSPFQTFRQRAYAFSGPPNTSMQTPTKNITTYCPEAMTTL